MTTFTAGQVVTDKVDGATLVVVEDRGTRVLVSSVKSVQPDATLLERAQWVLPASDLQAAA